MVVVSKVCSKCSTEKTLDNFDKMPAGKFGRAAACKLCCKTSSQNRNKAKRNGTFLNKNSSEIRAGEFLKDARQKYADNFSYNMSTFKGLSKPLEIMCIKHGKTYNQKPFWHLKSICGGCVDCQAEHLRDLQIKSQKDFLKDCFDTHGELYGYDRAIYTGSHDHVEIFCKRHNTYFWQTPTSHISKGSGCPTCATEDGHIKLRLTHEEFLDRATKAHGDRYKFDNVRYTYNFVPVQVTCTIHGDFPIAPNNLFLGKGCSRCASYGYNRGKPGSIYLLRSESLVKVGITNRDVKVRLEEINKSSGRDFKVLFSKEFSDGDAAPAIEYAMKVYLDTMGTRPIENFDGYTECFYVEDIQHIVKVVKQHVTNLQEILNVN